MLRFTIRELALVTLVVALAVSWGLDHRRLVNDATGWEAIAVLVTNANLGTDYEVGEPWELETRLKLRRDSPSPSSR
jgi:hypothetical protein